MSNPRIYQQQSFSIGDTVTLSEDAFGHTIRVLRLKSGDSLTLFNGEFNNGLLCDYQAELTDAHKISAQVVITSFTEKHVDSLLNILLAQCITSGD